MKSVAILFSAIACCLSAAPASSAWAQEPAASDASAEARDAEAHSLFQAGQSAFADGRFEEAYAHFSRAYELSQRTELLYNIAATLDRLARVDEAIDYYTRYLDEAGDVANRGYVERRIEILRTQEPSEASTAGDASDAGNASADVADASDAADATVDAGDAEATTPDELEPASGGHIGPYLLFGLAAGSLAAAITTGVLANGVYGDLESSCPGGHCDSSQRGRRDKLWRLSLSTDVLFGVTAVAGLSGFLWWLAGSADEAPVEAACSVDGCRVRVQGRF